jgi:hypothetical protein
VQEGTEEDPPGRLGKKKNPGYVAGRKIAHHPRSFARNQKVEHPSNRETLLARTPNGKYERILYVNLSITGKAILTPDVAFPGRGGSSLPNHLEKSRDGNDHRHDQPGALTVGKAFRFSHGIRDPGQAQHAWNVYHFGREVLSEEEQSGTSGVTRCLSKRGDKEALFSGDVLPRVRSIN